MPNAAPRSRPPLERMLRIHEELRAGRLPNCSTLARTFEISVKTAQRDIDFMRDRLGLPIAYHPTRFGFEYTEPVEHFPSVQVTEGEVIALFVARRAVEQYRGTPFERPLRAAFDKLAAGLREDITFTPGDLDAAISFRSAGAGVADIALFQSVSRAVLRSEELAFRYRKLGGRGEEERRVQPYHLACFENQWYLFAFDLARRGVRTFVLARMRDARPMATRFERPRDFSVANYLAGSFGVHSGSGKTVTVRIRFDAFAGQLVRERVWHPSQKVRPLRDGGIVLELRLGGFEELERWVLSWGPHAEVQSPAALRRRIATRLAEASARYR
jgi:predicted DNA-binding transcriptional regulator YafY